MAAQNQVPGSAPRGGIHQGFTIDRSMEVPEQEHANRVNRIVSTYLAATPEEQKAGRTWYRHAHRAAVTVAKGEEPGIGSYTKAMKRGVYRPPGLTDEAVDRASGAIARLSPSMPAGMDWEHNAQAAHEVGKLTDEQADAIKRGEPGARYQGEGIKHAGSEAILHARSILKGEVSPERDLNQAPGKKGMLAAREKIGSFYRNVRDPLHSREVTVDARAVGVAAGKRVGFRDIGPQVGKMAGKRYLGYERAYQDATDIINDHLAHAAAVAGQRPPRPLLPHMVQAGGWLADKRDLEWQIGDANGGRQSGAHLHAGKTGKPLSYRDFPTPVGQERTDSA